MANPDIPGQFAREEQDIEAAIRGQHGDQLRRGFEDAQRQLKFGAARTGQVGGSAYAQGLSDLEEQNALGGTRIADAVQRSINQLRAGREQAKLRAIDLVNQGVGEGAIQSATAGLQGAVQNARTMNEADLLGGLFQDVAFGQSAANADAKNQAALAYFQQARKPRVAGTRDPYGTITPSEY